MKKFIVLAVVFCNFSLLSHAAKFPQEGYVDPYSYSALSEDSFGFLPDEIYFATEVPSDSFSGESIVMQTSAQLTCAQMQATCAGCYDYVTLNSAACDDNTNVDAFETQWNSCQGPPPLGGLGPDACNWQPSLPVGEYLFSLLLLIGCYGIYAYRRKSILNHDLQD